MKKSTRHLGSLVGGDSILSFDRVSIHPSEKVASKAPFSMTLAPGELAVFEVSNASSLPDIAGLANGLVIPESGDVTYNGVPWRDLFDEKALDQRSSIGQVFNSQPIASWIENLDIDENVYLSEQMIGRQSQAQLAERAAKLARAFGLQEVPKERRSNVDRRDLMRAQWVRAFLPNPLNLLILERPTLGMDADSVNLLRKQISKAQERGTAVLWLDSKLSQSDHEALSPAHHFATTPPALLSSAS